MSRIYLRNASNSFGIHLPEIESFYENMYMSVSIPEWLCIISQLSSFSLTIIIDLTVPSANITILQTHMSCSYISLIWGTDKCQIKQIKVKLKIYSILCTKRRLCWRMIEKKKISASKRTFNFYSVFPKATRTTMRLMNTSKRLTHYKASQRTHTRAFVRERLELHLRAWSAFLTIKKKKLSR